MVEGVQVGYLAKSDSGAVTAMIKRSGKTKFEVPAQIGFDPKSPQPCIGDLLNLLGLGASNFLSSGFHNQSQICA